MRVVLWCFELAREGDALGYRWLVMFREELCSSLRALLCYWRSEIPPNNGGSKTLVKRLRYGPPIDVGMGILSFR